MYKEYHKLYQEYKKVNATYNGLLDKKIKTLLEVYPQANKIKEVLVNGGRIDNDTKLIAYVSEIEEVDKLLGETEKSRERLKNDLKNMATKMKEEGNVYDKIYYYKWIEHKSVYKFNKLLGYSVRQVYRFVDEIKEKIYSKNDKMAQNGTNLGL